MELRKELSNFATKSDLSRFAITVIGEFKKVNDRIDQSKRSTDKKIDQVLSKIDKLTHLFEADNRAIILHGQSLTGHAQTLAEHERRLGRLEAN
jgi:hypothetical protein